jgi:hypothetical protein
VDANTEREVARAVERQLAVLVLGFPSLLELPISPLSGVPDLVRLELAAQRFAEIHRSRRSKKLIREVGAILRVARARLRESAAVHSPGFRARQTPFHDTQPSV